MNQARHNVVALNPMLGIFLMRKFPLFILMASAWLFLWLPASAQEKSFQTAVLDKLTEIDKRLNEMDKRYEIRFANIEAEFKRIDERFNTVEVKIQAVNQRIDDKFNLILGMLGLIAAFLALLFIPKFLERYKASAENKKDVRHLQEQIDQLKAQLARQIGPAQ